MTWLRSATGDLRYLAWGRYRALLPSLDYLTGVRGRIEQAFLRTPFHRSSRDRDVPEIAQVAIEHLAAGLGTDSAALLLYTGYYKDTWFVGPTLSDRGEHAFVKLFKSPDQAAAEEERAEQAARLVGSGTFRTLQPTRRGALVSYDVMSRTARASDDDAMAVGVALAQGRSMDEVPASLRATWVSRGEVADGVLTRRFGRTGALLAPALATDVPWALTHGDVTPWNIIPTQEGLVLIDYERLAYRPAFFDVVYAGSQAPALKGAPSWAREQVQRELLLAGVGQNEMPHVLAAALSAAIVEATEDLAMHPENTRRLNRLISSKMRYLEEI